MAKLVEFDRGNAGKVWINPDHVVAVGPWNGETRILLTTHTDGLGKGVTISGRPEDAVLRLEEAAKAA